MEFERKNSGSELRVETTDDFAERISNGVNKMASSLWINVTHPFEKSTALKVKHLCCLVSCISLAVCYGLILSAIGPYFPTEANARGVSQTFVGVISSGTLFGQWSSCLVFIFLVSERNKVFVYNCGWLICASMSIAFGQCDKFQDKTLFISSSILVRVIMGIGSTCIWSTISPILVPFYPEHAGKVFSAPAVAAVFGFTFGPPIASFFFGIGGYNLAFLVIGVFSLFVGALCLISLLSLTTEKKVNRKVAQDLNAGRELSMSVRSLNAPKKFSTKSTRKFLTDPGIWVATLPLLSAVTQFGFFQVALAPHLLSEFGIDGKSSGQIFLFHGGASILSALFCGVFIDKGYASLIFIVSAFMTAVGYIVLIIPDFTDIVPAKLTLYAGLIILGLAFNGGYIPGYVLFERIALMHKVDDENQCRIYACTWLSTCFSFGVIIGQFLLGGLFFDTFKFYKTCMLSCAVMLVTATLGLVYFRRIGLFTNSNLPTDPIELHIDSSDCNNPNEEQIISDDAQTQPNQSYA